MPRVQFAVLKWYPGRMTKVETIQIPVFAVDSPEYEADFVAWTVEQARRVRLLRIPGIDSENLAEEVEALGRSDRRELLSRLVVVLMHLLKWRYQPSHRTPSWRNTIRVQRNQLDLLLSDSPSLTSLVPKMIARAYPQAVEDCAAETGMEQAVFPPVCPWAPGDILAKTFLPEP
jgi:hypothetical protein